MGKIVLVAKVRHLRVNNPLVNIWIISEKDGTIISVAARQDWLNPVPI